MRAAVFKGKQSLSVEEVPLPQPGPGQVLVKVKYCAICGSDVHRFQYGQLSPGAVMGHEYCGAIAAVGSGVTNWKVGDRVVGGGGTPPPGSPLPQMLSARYSPRTVGFTHGGTPGGYAEYALLDAWNLLAIPDNVSDELAVLTEPCSIAVHAVRLSRLRLGNSVAVLGAGPIGLLCVQVARAAGAGAVYVSEPAAARAASAARLGATRVFDPRKVDLVSEMVSLTGGLGVDVVFECAAAPSTLQHGLEMARRSGQVVVVAMAWENVPVLPVEWIGREVDMQASYGSLPEDWRISLDLMAQGKVRAEGMVSEEGYVPLARIQEAFEGLLKPSSQLQLLVVP